MAVVKWTLEDPSTLDTYTFEINPNQGGSPRLTKSIQYASTTAPDGAVLMFEGRDQPKETQVSGVILSEDQYNEMIVWFNKRHQVILTDDLGRSYTIYITSFDPSRERARSHPWKHSYTLSYTVMD